MIKGNTLEDSIGKYFQLTILKLQPARLFIIDRILAYILGNLWRARYTFRFIVIVKYLIS